MTQEDINRSAWENPNNWTAGSKLLCVYFSHEDSRTVVPKRNPAHGWTVNLAKPGGVRILIGSILGVILLTIVVSTIVLMLET